MQAYKPFKEVDYMICRGNELSWIELTGFSYSNIDCRAWIQHQINREKGYVDVWTLGFDKESGEHVSGKLSEYLESLEFSEGIREFDTQEELIECLQKLCKKLQEL
jgi:hypothetical protein